MEFSTHAHGCNSFTSSMRQKPIEKNLFNKNCGNDFKTFQLRRWRNALILLVGKTQIKKITFYVATHDNFKTSYEKKNQ